jgi:hypothetical protein
MKTLVAITVTGSLLAYSLLACNQLAKYDLFFHAYHKPVTVKKYCCNQNKNCLASAAKKMHKA